MLSLTQIKWAIIAFLFATACLMSFRVGSGLKQAEWDREKAVANAQAAEALQAANERVRETEAAAAARVADVDARLTKEKKERRNAETAAIDRARDGGLYIDATCPDNNDTVPGAPGSPGASHGETRAKLSGAAGEALIRLLSEADEVAVQLQACQQLLEAERK